METTKRVRSGKFTKQQVIDTLNRHKGGVYATANELGCHYSTVYNYANRYPEIKAILDDSRNVLLDKVELRIVELMASDNEAVALKACMFLLETIGKERGYSRQREVVNNNNVIIDTDQLRDRLRQRIESEAMAE